MNCGPVSASDHPSTGTARHRKVMWEFNSPPRPRTTPLPRGRWVSGTEQRKRTECGRLRRPGHNPAPPQMLCFARPLRTVVWETGAHLGRGRGGGCSVLEKAEPAAPRGRALSCWAEAGAQVEKPEGPLGAWTLSSSGTRLLTRENRFPPTFCSEQKSPSSSLEQLVT